MPEPSPAEKIFFAALEKGTPAERASYLDDACRDAPALRRSVERLLEAHAKESGSAAHSPDELQDTVDPARDQQPAAGRSTSIDDLVGTRVGPYKLLEQIGVGGMGVVYMAEQHEPIRRRVALKIIKPGLDTRQVIARFEAERQALALMDHTNIARVLDAGATPSGRSYFVMELVRGVPITEYCDANNLPVHERLELFVQVCRAVQHAHQKGIIHRDIKPSNVLVTMNDGRAIPKVIDFGVAKATNQQLTEMTLFTNFAQMVGTPLYMSPEQAEMTSLDIDTRTDIYSLGVLLYELLTGTTPFDRKVLGEAAFDEIRRIIREQVPPRPSQRISTLGQQRTAVAVHRLSDPARLCQIVRGELDWIVMKALEKDRTRRYETAAGLAADVNRYLTNQPVEASPPSTLYRVRKFASRNRVAIATAGALFSVLLLGTAVSTWQAIRATQAERRADEQAAEAQANAAAALAEKQRADAKTKEAEDRAREAITERERADEQAARAEASLAEAMLQRERAEAGYLAAREAVDEYFTSVSESTLLNVPGLQPLRKELLGSALAYFQRLTGESADNPQARADLAEAYVRVGNITSQIGSHADATAALQKAIEIFESLDAETQATAKNQAWLADARLSLGAAQSEVGHNAEAEASCRRALEMYEELNRTHPRNVRYQLGLASACGTLSSIQYRTAPKSDLEALDRRALAIYEKLADEHPTDSYYQRRLAGAYNKLGIIQYHTARRDDAEASYRVAIETYKKLLRENPNDSYGEGLLSTVYGNLANNYASAGRFAEAEASFRRAIEIRSKLVRENPTVTDYQYSLGLNYCNLANAYRVAGQYGDCLTSCHEALKVLEPLSKAEPSNTEVEREVNRCRSHLLMLWSFHGVGDRGEVEQYADALKEIRRPEFNYVAAVGVTLFRLGRYGEADKALKHGIALMNSASVLDPIFADYGGHYWRVILQIMLAMNEQQLGQSDAAAATLKRATKNLDELRARYGTEGRISPRKTHGVDIDALLSEAAALLDRNITDTDGPTERTKP